MGRFQLNDDHDDDRHLHDVSCRDWNFVALPGEEGALVPQNNSNNDNSTQDNLEVEEEERVHRPTERTVYVVYQQPPHLPQFFSPHPLDNYDITKRKYVWPLWLKISIVAFLCQLIWYLWYHGPPAPPIQQLNDADTTTITTWNEYVKQHADALVTAATALFVNLPYHILSWWSVHVHSDVYQWYESYRKPRPYCPWEWDKIKTQRGNVDFAANLEKCFVTKSQPLARQRLMESLLAWNYENQALVLLVSSMTVGLAAETLGPCLVERVLYPTCHGNDASWAILPMGTGMDPTALRNTLIQALNPWQGRHGGVVVLTDVHLLDEESFRWLLDALTSPANPDKDNADRRWIHSLTSRVIFVLTSDEIGRPSLIRHQRENGGSSTASLQLDLRHDWQTHGAHGSFPLLPLFALSPESVQLYVRLRMEEVLQGWTVNYLVKDDDNKNNVAETLVAAFPDKTLWVHFTALQAMTGPEIMEYVDWSADIDGQEVYIMTFSSAGVQPAEEKLQWLVGRFGVCVNGGHYQNENLSLLLNYDDTTSRMLIKRCLNMAASSCVDVCSFPIL